MKRESFSRLSVFGLFLLSLTISASANAGWRTNRAFHGWYASNYGGYHSSTEAEGFLRGMGAYYDGLGRLHLSNAVAARHMQEAYRLYLENQKLRVQTYYDIKEIRRKAVFGDKKPAAPVGAAAARAKAAAPARLAASDRSPATGEFNWPKVLREDVYKEGRQDLEDLFSERDADPAGAGLGSDNYTLIKAVTDRVSELLVSRLPEYAPMDYIAARNFLKTLAYEARFKP